MFSIGTTEVSMKSNQAVGSNKLQHRFSLTFGGQVNLALNVIRARFMLAEPIANLSPL